MQIETFGVERWIGKYEYKVPYDLAETSVHPLTVREVLSLAGASAEEVLSDIRLDYGENPGSESLRAEIAREHPTCSAENVLVTHGAIEANALLYLAMFEPGDRVVVLVPTYQQLYELPRFLGATVDFWKMHPESGFTPDLEDLRQRLRPGTKAVVVNSPNNPTGAALSEEELRHLVELAESTGAWVISDEVYRGISYEGVPVPPMTELYSRGITVGSLSKVYALPGLRLGWIVAPEEIIEACVRFRDYLTISTPKISDTLATLALRHRQALLGRSSELMRRNRSILLDWANRMAAKTTLVPPRAGTTALVGYNVDLPSEELGRILAEEFGVLVVPGSCFDVEHHFRIGYGCPTETLIQGLEQISRCLG